MFEKWWWKATFTHSLRRLLCLIAGLVLAYQYAWHKDWLGKQPWLKFGWLALVLLFVGLVIAALVKRTGMLVALAIAASIAVGWLHSKIDIPFSRVLIDLGVAVGLLVLLLGVIVHDWQGLKLGSFSVKKPSLGKYKLQLTKQT